MKRVGAKRRSEIPRSTLHALNQGLLESANLVELLAIDFAILMQTILPKASKETLKPLLNSEGLGVTKRMLLAAEMILEHRGFSLVEKLKGHSSDIIRSWACFMIGCAPKLTLAQRLKLLKPLADDPHSGVREWAWMAIRTFLASDIETAIQKLIPWVYEESERIRRFAIESTRPRGVWCCHIDRLKQDPSLGLSLLEPLKSDGSVYVQKSVGNWLNDAGKSDPQWVIAQCKRWQKKSATVETHKICKRALRNL